MRVRSDAELNGIIAKWMGWKPYSSEGRLEWDGQGYSRTPIMPPSYCTDLNAIHDAVSRLDKDPYHWWAKRLSEICGDYSKAANANPRQCSEALVELMES